eukprot:COSAG04_NODE_15_length_40535_cov_25.319888_15_plen_102_part_00
MTRAAESLLLDVPEQRVWARREPERRMQVLVLGRQGVGVADGRHRAQRVRGQCVRLNSSCGGAPCVRSSRRRRCVLQEAEATRPGHPLLAMPALTDRSRMV